jgi:hypothetical protein
MLELTRLIQSMSLIIDMSKQQFADLYLTKLPKDLTSVHRYALPELDLEDCETQWDAINPVYAPLLFN